MKNESITKEELLNAGAVKKDVGSLYVLNLEDFPYSFYINPPLNSLRIYYGDCFHNQVECPTREGFAFIVKTLTGKDLDFTPKQKDYSWYSVYMSLPQQSRLFVDESIISLSKLSATLSLKLIALLKLHYIIEELDRDFEGDGESIHTFWVCADEVMQYCDEDWGQNRSTATIYTVSPKSAQILIDNHAQLLKDALGVK